MDIPNSPVELMQLCAIEKLSTLPEGSTVEMPAEALRELLCHYMDNLELIKEQHQIIQDQQQLINVFAENS